MCIVRAGSFITCLTFNKRCIAIFIGYVLIIRVFDLFSLTFCCSIFFCFDFSCSLRPRPFLLFLLSVGMVSRDALS